MVSAGSPRRRKELESRFCLTWRNNRRHKEMSFEKIPVFGAEPYGFKATDVTGCRAWFDAADVTSLYNTTPITGMPTGYSDYASADGQRVTVWEDKSTGGNDMIRNVGASFGDTSSNYMGPPIVAPDTYPTTLSVVNLDQGNNSGGGGGDAGGTSNAPSFLQQNLVAVGGYEASGGPGSARGPRVGTGISATTDIFVVVKPKFLTVAGDVFSIGTRTYPQGTQDFTCLTITSSGYWKINSQAGARDVTGGNAEVFDTFSNIRGPDPNYRILHMSLSNNNYILRRNGSQIGISTAYTWSPNLANYRYYMGRKNASDNAGNYFNGKIGEIIVYNNIITTEKRLIVESYLAGKWNLIDLLPLDHPARLKNIPFYLGGRSLEAEPNGFVRRTTTVKIFVLPPEAPTVNAPTITLGGLIFTVSWSSNGGTPDYYNITILQSTDDSTWTTIGYTSRYQTTSFNHIIGGVDNKYYQAVIQSKNLGGGASTTSSSILNSVPAPPSPSIPTTTGTSNLSMSWTPVFPGGVPVSYTVYLYISTNGGSTFTQTDTYSNITGTTYTVIEKCVLLEQYKIKVTATNTIGTSAQSAFSSTFTYNGAGS